MANNASAATVGHLMKYPWFAFAIVMTFAGCQRIPAPSTPGNEGPTSRGVLDAVEYKLAAYDAAKKLVATGDLSLPRDLPPAGQSFEGTW
jgi:hypothetical protein